MPNGKMSAEEAQRQEAIQKLKEKIELSKAISQTSLSMQPHQHQHNANNDSNRNHLANERCLMFFGFDLRKRSHCLVNLGHW
jgi:hypothetical protein